MSVTTIDRSHQDDPPVGLDDPEVQASLSQQILSDPA